MLLELLSQAGTYAITNHQEILMLVGLGFGLYMAWCIGANDVANAMGTSVGSGALTLKKAILVAGILEFAGAFLVGQHVTGAIRKDILPYEAFAHSPDDYVFGMLAALLAAAVWLQLATYLGLPVSTTHTIVGAIVGFGLVAVDDWGMIRWDKVGSIVSSWVVSPVLSGVIAFFIFFIIQREVFYKEDLLAACRRVAPFFVFAVFFTIILVTLWKGLKPLKLNLDWKPALLWAGGLSLIATFATIPLIMKVRLAEGEESTDPELQSPMVCEELERMGEKLKRMSGVASGSVRVTLEDLKGQVEDLKRQVKPKTPEVRTVERVFIYLQIMSACAVAFAHGANDVANAVGPLSGVVSALINEGISKTTVLPQEWGMGILAVGGLGIVVGLAMWGRRVIETIGKKITELTPTRGFSAEFGTAITILLASRLALPVSTTHTLVGAVLGVGFARGVGALNLRVVRDIFASWVVTLPAGVILSIIFFYLLRAVFGA